MKLKTVHVVKFFEENSLPIPPRSVCNACFANNIEYLREMHQERPEDWKQAVAVDKAVRDWKQIGVKDEVFVSKSLLSLEELAAQNFGVDEGEYDEWCQTGYCFT